MRHTRNLMLIMSYLHDYIICYNSAISLRRGVHVLYTFTVFTNFVNITFWYTACMPPLWNRFIPVSWILRQSCYLRIHQSFILCSAHTKSMRIFNFLEKEKQGCLKCYKRYISIWFCYYRKRRMNYDRIKWKFMIFE